MYEPDRIQLRAPTAESRIRIRREDGALGLPQSALVTRHLEPRIMHHCLTTVEVISLVCEELAIDPRKAAYPALVRLAQTCRWMYEPAMNSLWYSLFDLAPLLRCFPEDVWDDDDESMDNFVSPTSVSCPKD